MFTITAGKGFQITFDNGVILSVQFGPGNYCENKDLDFDIPKKERFYRSKNAEIAIILPNGEFYQFEESEDQVQGWQNVEDFCKWLDLAKNMKF